MKDFEQLDISGDAGLRIMGGSLEELFENAAIGMFSLITDLSVIPVSEEKRIELTADNHENLLVGWLNENVFLFDTYGFVGTQFSVAISGGRRDNGIGLKAVVRGGIFDPGGSERGLLIKAATYHGISIRKTGGCWEAEVIFDI